ncbi:MAG: transporter substrate-binding domain-containing protein [Magnetococcales bacterium]|nr:transporter substrate-binding domain-containing protein [Magnetococcales bacterium]
MVACSRISILLTCLSVGVVVMSGAWAGPVKCGDHPIRLGYYENGFLYDKGVGINQDIVEELRKRSGCRFEARVMTRARIWADLASGDMDMSVSGLKTAERDKIAWFVDYMRMKTYAIVHNDVVSRVQSAREFLHQTQLQIGVVSSLKYGGPNDQWLDQLSLAGRVQETSEAESIFRKLKSHRLDAVFAQPPVFRKYLRDLAMNDLVEVQDWSPEEKGQTYGLVLTRSRHDAMDVEPWRVLIGELKQEGVLRKIFLKYLPAKDADAMLIE